MIRWLRDGPLKGFPDLPPVWLAGFLALAWLFDAGVPLVRVAGPVLQGLGALAALAGLGLIGWSALWFWRKRTTIEPHHTPRVLIVEGPYRLSRNPIYLGMVAILAGYALWLGTLAPLVLPPVFAAVIARRFIAREEEVLRRQFGAAAQDYLRQTRRWL